MYVTLADMLDAFGENEVLAISDRENSGEIDTAVINEGLRRAISEAESYLSRRYSMPPAACPAVLTAVVCDIARYRLTGGPATETDPIRERYKLAIAWLEQVAQGKVDLAELEEAGQECGDVQMSSNPVVWGQIL